MEQCGDAYLCLVVERPEPRNLNNINNDETQICASTSANRFLQTSSECVYEVEMLGSADLRFDRLRMLVEFILLSSHARVIVCESGQLV